MIVRVSGSSIASDINVSINGSGLSTVTTGSAVQPVTLIITGSGVPGSSGIQVNVPQFVVHANSSDTATFAETAGTASVVFGSIESSSYATYAVSSSYAPPTSPFPYTGTAIVTGSLTTTQDVTSNKFSLDSLSGIFVLTGSVTTGIFGVTENIYPRISTGSFSGAIIEYLAKRSSGLRIGMVMGIWHNGSYTFTDISSTDLGDTSDLTTGFLSVGSDFIFQVNSAGSGSGTWTVQTLFKLFPV